MGLKQSPRQWHQTLNKTLIDIGYLPTRSDSCVYTKRVDGHPPILIGIYVDDCIIAVHPDIEHVWLADKNRLMEIYNLSDIGECKWLLNLTFTQWPDQSIIQMCAHASVRELLEKHRMSECKPAATPAILTDLNDPSLPAGTPLTVEQHQTYRSIVGSVQYMASTTRPDVAHAVNQLARQLAAPTTTHMTAAKHVLRYLRGTIHQCLQYNHSPTDQLQLTAYSDADWAGCKETRRSTTGYVVMLNGNVISWETKKMSTVALSSTESELAGAVMAVKELQWLRMLIHDIVGIHPPLQLNVDNQSCLALLRSDAHHERTKHVDTRYHYVRDMVKFHELDLLWVPTEEQLADILTKPASNLVYQRLMPQLMGQCILE